MKMSSTQCDLYQYAPSLPLAVVAIIIFSVLTTIHVVRIKRSRTWSGIYFIFGGIAQTSGYTARIFSTQNPCNRFAYGFQSVLLLVGPTLMMFSVNLTMTEFTRALRAERFCWIPIDLQRPLYLSMNMVLLLIQAIGNIMTVSTANIATIKAGAKIGIAIFVVQLVFWLLTLAEHTYITIRLRRGLAEASEATFPNWKYWSQLFGLAASIIALGRNMVRLAMSGGIEFLLVNEWPSYAFDGYQMAVVLGAWAIWYLPDKCHGALKTTSQSGIPILHTSDSRDSRDRRVRGTHSRLVRMQRRDERLHRESY